MAAEVVTQPRIMGTDNDEAGYGVRVYVARECQKESAV
jgi:hypothetical protein